MLWQFAEHHVIVRYTTAEAEAFFHAFRIVAALVVKISVPGKTGKTHDQTALGAVVPNGGEYLRNALFKAGFQGGNSELQRTGVQGAVTAPCPHAAGEQNVLAEDLMMLVDIHGVEFFFGNVVIPEHLLNSLGNGADDLIGKFHPHIVIPIAGQTLACQTEEHIAPHHRLETVTPGHVSDFGKMREIDILTRFVAVPIQIGTGAQIMSLVHAHVQTAGSEAGGDGFEQIVDQLIGFRGIDQKSVGGILIGIGGLPAQMSRQMTQHLHAGDQLNAQLQGVGVQFPDLIGGIAAPHIAEVGAAFHFISIFRVEHVGVQTHHCHFPKHHLHSFHIHNRITGHIHHSAVGFEHRLFRNTVLLFSFFDPVYQHSKTTEKSCLSGAVGDAGSTAAERHCQHLNRFFVDSHGIIRALFLC